MPIPDRVWSHFSDLERINELFDDGRTVHVFTEPFGHQRQREIAELRNAELAALSRDRVSCSVISQIASVDVESRLAQEIKHASEVPEDQGLIQSQTQRVLGKLTSMNEPERLKVAGSSNRR
jgi:hypothetical protein